MEEQPVMDNHDNGDDDYDYDDDYYACMYCTFCLIVISPYLHQMCCAHTCIPFVLIASQLCGR